MDEQAEYNQELAHAEALARYGAEIARLTQERDEAEAALLAFVDLIGELAVSKCIATSRLPYGVPQLLRAHLIGAHALSQHRAIVDRARQRAEKKEGE